MKILILNGNNQRQSLSSDICDAYRTGAAKAGHDVQTIKIGEITFDPILHEGYHTVQELEPDLVSFQKDVKWCDHFVIVYPTWWGGMPALLKGLFDRSFYSGYAYRYHDNDPLWDKLLKGRSAHIITTMDAPYIWYFFAYWSAGTNMLRNAILKFCGIAPVKTTFINRVRYKTRQQLKKDLEKIKNMAERL